MDADPASTGSILFLLLQEPVPVFRIAVQAIFLILLLLASAFFSGSEVALFSLDASTRESMAESDDSGDRRALALLHDPRQILVTILILNTLVNVCAAILAAVMIAGVAEALGWSPTWTLLAEMVTLTFVLLVVSEITPKLIAARHARQYTRIAAGTLSVLHRVLRPLSSMLAGMMSSLQRRLAMRVHHPLSPDDLKAMAEIGEAHGTLEEEERELIHSIVEFGETTVREVMVSRLDVVALPVSASVPEAVSIIRSSGHSRLPLFVEHLDNILGVVYAKDLLPYLNGSNGTMRIDWTRIARPPMFVPPGKMLDDLLRDFQAKKTHMAIVVDEYGGTAGLVTMEDVLEEIVGEIRDEHDEWESEILERLSEDTYRIDARINLDELNEALGLELDTETFDFETLGGLVFHLTGEIPTVGTEVAHDFLQMRVETIESNRIGKVVVRVTPVVERQAIDERRASDNS